MKRRTLLLAVALGSGSAVGTGAVSELSAERGITVSASADDSAIVQLEPIDDGDTLDELVIIEDGELKLTITGLSDAGAGVNTNAVTAFDDLVRVTNGSANELAIWFTSFGTENITAEFYTGDAPGQDPSDGQDVTVRTGDANAFSLPSGGSQKLGVLIDTSGVDSATSSGDSVTITAGVSVDGGQSS